MFNFKARRNLLVDEKNMSAILGVLDKHKIRCVSIGNCGWADFTDRWFIFFTASDKSYSSVMKDLTKIGTIKIEVRPGGQIDNYFTKEGF